MGHSLFYVILLALIFTSVNFTTSQAYYLKVIKIGGIFQKDDSMQAHAFQAAVEEVNGNNAMFPYIHLTSYVEYISGDGAHELKMKVCKLLGLGVVSIFGPSDPFSATYIQSICDVMDIPCIQTRLDIRQRVGRQVFNIHPYHVTLVKAYIDLLKSWQWDSFALIYENINSMMIVQEIMLEFAPISEKFSMMMMAEDGDYRELLWSLKYAGQKNIFLYASANGVYEFMKQAQQVGMVTDEHSYLISSLDFQTIDLESFKYAKANITGVRVVNPSGLATEAWSAMHSYSVTYLNKSSQSLTTEASLTYDAVFMYAKAVSSLYAHKKFEMEDVEPLDCEREKTWFYGSSLANELRVTNIDGITGQLALDPMGNRTEFHLDVVELYPDGLQTAGYWTPKNNFTRIATSHSSTISNPVTCGATMTSDETLACLVNKTLIISTFLNDPFTMRKLAVEKKFGNDQFEGFVPDFLDLLARNLSFRYKIQLVRDNSYGKLINGTWNGMIGEVKSGVADMVVADVSVNADRAEALDFTLPFMQLGIGVLYVKPKRAPPSFMSFMAPFSMDVWLYMTLSFVGVSFIMFFLSRMAPDEWDNPYPCTENPSELENQFDFLSNFWFTIATLMQQGCELAPKAVSTRIVASIWAFFILIIISSYTANLAAFLTSDKPSSPFAHAKDLAHQTEIKYGCVESGTTGKFFEGSTDEDYKVMFNFMKQNKGSFVGNNDEGLKKVVDMKGKFAFFMESTVIEYQVERNCELYQIGSWLDNKGYGIGFAKGSPFTQVFNTQIVSLQERGEIRALKNKWWKEKRKGAPCVEVPPNMALGLANVAGVFGLLLVGNIIATCIAIGEFIYAHRQTAKEEKVSFWSVVKDDLKLILNFDSDTKPVRKKPANGSKTSSNKNTSEDSVIRNVNADMKRRSRSDEHKI